MEESTSSQAQRPLTPKQERRIIDFLDAKFLELERGVRKRHIPSSPVPNLEHFLTFCTTLLNLILSIPPISPSNQLRSAFLLRFTGEVIGEGLVGGGGGGEGGGGGGGSLGSGGEVTAGGSREEGYILEGIRSSSTSTTTTSSNNNDHHHHHRHHNSSLQANIKLGNSMWSFFDLVDKGWSAVLEGLPWSTTLGEGINCKLTTPDSPSTNASIENSTRTRTLNDNHEYNQLPNNSSGIDIDDVTVIISQTDRTRLLSILNSIQQTMRGLAINENSRSCQESSTNEKIPDSDPAWPSTSTRTSTTTVVETRNNNNNLDIEGTTTDDDDNDDEEEEEDDIEFEEVSELDSTDAKNKNKIIQDISSTSDMSLMMSIDRTNDDDIEPERGDDEFEEEEEEEEEDYDDDQSSESEIEQFKPKKKKKPISNNRKGKGAAGGGGGGGGGLGFVNKKSHDDDILGMFSEEIEEEEEEEGADGLPPLWNYQRVQNENLEEKVENLFHRTFKHLRS